MSKHTPGPWLITGTTIYALDERGICNRFSAQVQGGYQVHGRGLYDGRRTTEDELAANARLIAAAPELLEALRLASETLHRINNDGEFNDECAAARAAIAKAEGK